MSVPHDPTASAPVSCEVRPCVALAAQRDAPLRPPRPLTPAERARLRVLIARASPGGDLRERARARWEARERVLGEDWGGGEELP